MTGPIRSKRHGENCIRSRGRPTDQVPALRGRNLEIVTLYQQGRTFRELAHRYRLSRERRRQIVESAGVAREDGGATVRAQQRQAARLAKREAYYLQRGYAKGVRRTSAGHYNARRMRNGKERNLGTYATVEEAAAAYAAA